MSSNLLKWGHTNVQQGDARLIDVNALLEKRLGELSVQAPVDKSRGGFEDFVSGLAAEAVELEENGADGEDPGETSGNVIKAVTETPEELLAKANEEAAATVERAQREASQLLEDTRRQAEAEKEQVLEEARLKGYEEGSRQAEEKIAAMKRQLEEKERQLEAQFQKQVDELEPKFIEVITGVYQEIFHVELDSYREILVYLISNTIRSVENSREFLVRVSREDYPFVSMQKKQLQAASPNGSVEVMEDAVLGKNECMIETESGIFDCGLGTELDELTRRLRLLSYGK